MHITETLKTSLRALLSNKMRAFLTTLGVVIGVFAVIVLVSLVQGIENFVVDRFNSLGSNLIVISPGRAGFDSDPALSFTHNKLDFKHVELVNREVGEHLVGVVPNIRIGKNAKYKTKSHYATVLGTNQTAMEIINVDLTQGRFFTKQEVDAKAKVAIIGPKIEENLFGASNPINKKIKIGDISLTVIGVTTPKGAEFDERVIMPYTTVKNSLGVTNLSGIMTRAKDGEDIDNVSRLIEYALLQDLKRDDFTVLSQKDILESVQRILGILSIGLAAIAGISLLVGGIGIMNIMLVSVTERTREIGLRKALGATPKNIGFQFVFEAVVISSIGGIAGLLLSFLTTFAIRSFIRASVPWWAILMALGFSFVVGTVFGTYPALQASKKDPIEALRYE